MKLKIYLAGPLFSESERSWLLALKQQIIAVGTECGRQVEVLWPWEFFDQAELIASGDQAKYKVFSGCLDGIDQADLVVALLDGTQVDDGTAFELGYFYRAHRNTSRIIGIRTDFRAGGECAGSCVNAMIEGACSRIARSVPELLEVLRARFALQE